MDRLLAISDGDIRGETVLFNGEVGLFPVSSASALIVGETI